MEYRKKVPAVTTHFHSGAEERVNAVTHIPPTGSRVEGQSINLRPPPRLGTTLLGCCCQGSHRPAYSSHPGAAECKLKACVRIRPYPGNTGTGTTSTPPPPRFYLVNPIISGLVHGGGLQA